MSTEPEHAPPPSAYTVGAAFPHPHAANPGRDATRWGSAPPDYTPGAGQASPWSAPSVGEPVVALAPTEPAALRVWGFRDQTRAAHEPGPSGDAA